MKSNTSKSTDRDLIHGLRLDCKRWRSLVLQCGHSTNFVSTATEEYYQTVHGRILAACHKIADQESASSSLRHMALQLDELLRPWSSTRAFQEAPSQLISRLVEDQTSLERQLRGNTQGFLATRLRHKTRTACFAVLVGITAFLFFEWTSSDASHPVFRSVQFLFSSVAAYVEQTTFTEQFAIAVLLTWIFGTYLLSRLSSS